MLVGEVRELEMDEKKELSGEEKDFVLYPYRLHSKGDLEEIDRERIEKRFFDELKSLSEEALQLTEFLSEDKRLCHELCSLLRDSLGRLDLTIDVQVRALPFLEKTERVMLNTHCHLIIVKEDGRIDSVDLEEYPSEVVLMVVWNILPKLKVLVAEYTKKVKLRVEYFDRIGRDLRNLQGAFNLPHEEDIPVEDLYQGQRSAAVSFKT